MAVKAGTGQGPPLVVAVTGGIGSGKSTAAALFEQRGATVIDTDAIAQHLTAPGQPAVSRIVERFGTQYRDEHGALDRAKMRTLVFASPDARRELEALLHPLIESEVRRRVALAPPPYVLLLIPLLAESGGYPGLTERVVVVDCDESTQIRRTMARSKLSEPEVRAIMAAQAPRSARLALADDVIVNDGDQDALVSQVEVLDARYRALHAAREQT